MMSNEQVLDLAKEERKLMKEMVQGQLKSFGHIVRGDGPERSVLEGKIEGSRWRGRQKNAFLTA